MLLDLDLPDIHGVDLARQIRAAGNRTPIVVLTGYPAPTSAFEAGQLGLSSYLEKPIDPKILHERLVSATKKSTDHIAIRNEISIPVEGSARDRIGAVVVRGAFAQSDLPTLDRWGEHAGVAGSTLKGWCATVKIAPRKALLFTRVLRAVIIQQTTGRAIVDSLEILDRRTLRRVFLLAGLQSSEDGVVAISVKDLLDRQHLIIDRALITRISGLLIASGFKLAG